MKSIRPQHVRTVFESCLGDLERRTSHREFKIPCGLGRSLSNDPEGLKVYPGLLHIKVVQGSSTIT